MHIVTVHFEVKPAHKADFLREICNNAACSLQREPHCRQFDVCTSQNDDRVVFLYEAYDDVAAFQAHLATEHYKSFDAVTREWVLAKQVSQFVRLD